MGPLRGKDKTTTNQGHCELSYSKPDKPNNLDDNSNNSNNNNNNIDNEERHHKEHLKQLILISQASKTLQATAKTANFDIQSYQNLTGNS